MRKMRFVLVIAVLGLMLAHSAVAEEVQVPYWTQGSAVLKSITDFVSGVTDTGSADYVPEEDRIAVFDFDGTLFGELFPTYFDECLFLHRVLHDPDYEAAEDVKTYAQAYEQALLSHEPLPESPRSGAQMAAESFVGFTIEQYRAYIRDFMQTPVPGFEGMTYAEGFYRPMVSLVEYLSGQGFRVFISSGSERTLVRELTKGVLDRWVPSERVIGSVFSIAASGQGETAGRSYTYKADDQVLYTGSLVTKNQKANKVYSIIDEIGKAPVLVFGNSSGDLAMGQYAVQHGGRAYMLLCDDVQRDYGNLKTAADFAGKCADLGFETVSMRDDFATIYGENVVCTHEDEETAAPAA